MGHKDVLEAKHNKKTIECMVNCIGSRLTIINNLLLQKREQEADQKYDDLILWVENNYTIKRDD